MRLASIVVDVSSVEELEVIEVPPGWEPFRTTLDRGMWYVLLKREEEKTKKAKAPPEEEETEV